MLCLRVLCTAHTQTNHAITSAVIRVRAPMEARALSYATTPNTSSTASAGLDTSVTFVKSGEPSSFKEKFRRKRQFVSGVYHLFDSSTSFMYKAFCDFNPEERIIWSHVESFIWLIRTSLSPEHFFEDNQVNQNQFSWGRFRLSLSRCLRSHNTLRLPEPDATLIVMG